MDLTVSETGGDQVLKALAKLPRAIRNRALRPALRAGAEVIKAQASDNVKSMAVAGYSKGLLARSLTVVPLKSRKNALRTAVAIQPRKRSAAGVRVGLYGSVFQHGRKRGNSKQQPMPFMSNAARGTKSEVYSVVRRTARAGLDAAVKEAMG